MIYIIISIIIFNILLFYLLKNVKKYILIGSIITILSGYLVILGGYIFKAYIKKRIKYINISFLINYFLEKNNTNGLVLILIGSIQLIIYVIIVFIKRKEELINNSSIHSLSRIHWGI